MKLNVEYYETESGRIPVMEFIESLDNKNQAKVIHTIELLEEFGTGLTPPHAKHVEGKLWELRSGAERIIYFIFSDVKGILLHGFTKKQKKIAQKEIETSRKRYKNYTERYKK